MIACTSCAVGDQLRIGNGRRRHLEGRLIGRIDRPVGRDQHAERFLRAPNRQARLFDARVVSRHFLLRAQRIQAAADAALVALIGVLVVRLRVVARPLVQLEDAAPGDDREVAFSAATATARRASSAARTETSTSSSAWLRSAQRTGVSSGTLSPAVVTVCVRGLMLVP